MEGNLRWMRDVAVFSAAAVFAMFSLDSRDARQNTSYVMGFVGRTNTTTGVCNSYKILRRNKYTHRFPQMFLFSKKACGCVPGGVQFKGIFTIGGGINLAKTKRHEKSEINERSFLGDCYT